MQVNAILLKERRNTLTAEHVEQSFCRSPEFPTNLSDKIVLAETYYGYLEHLIKHGKLPEDRRIDRTG